MNKYASLIACLLCCAAAIYFITQYFRERPKPSMIQAYTTLLHEGKPAVAQIQPIGTSKTVIVNGNPETFYPVTYSFKAGNKSYGGETSMQRLKSRTITILYLPRYPFINSADPQAELEAEKNKGTLAPLWLAGLSLLCAGGAFILFRKVVAKERFVATHE